MKQQEKNKTQKRVTARLDKRCNMKKLKSEKNGAILKECNTKTVQLEKRCKMKRVKHEKNETRKKCNTK